MKLEVLLSTINLDKKNLDSMNITSDCIVINQCSKNTYEEYKDFKIYSYNEKGTSLSRNKALGKATGDILLLCDDDIIYNSDYETIILDEFEKNEEADVIVFNLFCEDRLQKNIIKNKKVKFYNCLRYGSPQIAFKRSKIEQKQIKFDLDFGPNAKYSCGEDTLFIVTCLKEKLKIFSSPKFIGTIKKSPSTWFCGYNEKFFFDKGAIFYAINKNISLILCLQYLIRHKETLQNINFTKALRLMMAGMENYKINIKDYREVL